MAQENPELLPVPAQWTDVTPAWMSAAIARHHPGAKVSEVTLLLDDDGTNRRARFGLNYAVGSGPTTVFAKAESDTPRIRQAHARNGNMFNESRLFNSDVAIPVEHPTAYAAVIDEPGLNYVIVMEDLVARGADPRNVTRPMTIDQVANGVLGLARLHSHYWDRVNDHAALDWVQPFLPTAGWQASMETGIPRGLEVVGDKLPNAVTKLSRDELQSAWRRYIGTLTHGPQTLLHGDPHIGNTYLLNDNEVGFLDWQVVRSGNWSLDVGYFMQSALTEADRRHSEAELIETYRQALDVPNERRPTREEAWLNYRASAAHGLVIWLVTAASAKQVHSSEICLEMVRRYGVAFAELDTVGALRKLGAN
jgi:hypothetical protein